jgi:hypothetical protein
MEDRDRVAGLDDYPLPEAIFGKSAQAGGEPKEGTDDGKSGTADGQ